MGTSCGRRTSVHVLPKPVEEPISKQEQIRRRKSQLFLNEEYESSFIEFSTPRTGRLIKWKRGELLGEGAYAKVFQCMNIETGELLAVKHFALSDERIQKEFNNMKKEVSLLKTLDHPNVVQYFQTDLSSDLSAIDVVLEYVPGGSLKRVLQKYNSLAEDVIRSYARQLLKGLAYLHDHGVVHRDLKSANVLITPHGVVKLTDFGSSRRFDGPDSSISKSLKGSPYWMAPEVVTRRGHSFSADIWSFGCVLIEMVTGQPPWSNFSRNAKDVLRLISAPDNLPTIPPSSPSLKALINLCLQRKPSKRPSVGTLLGHPFFAEGEPTLEGTLTKTISKIKGIREEVKEELSSNSIKQ